MFNQSQDLRQQLLQLDARSYKAYKSIQNSYNFPEFTLMIDRVQGDPFATPSQLRVQIPQTIAGFPSNLYENSSREIALCDYITRVFCQATEQVSSRRGSGNSGLIAIISVGQSVIKRSAVLINNESLEVRFIVGLPAHGRQIAGRQAAQMLCDDIPTIVNSIKYQSLDASAIKHHVETVEDADYLRQQLEANGLVTFVADGAILPRSSGVDDQPLKAAAEAFQTPETLRVEFNCPNRGLVAGMGIPAGVTLIVGGGYHGKSTLLKAIELGVYNHIPDDGREFVVTQTTAVKIRAEDGRSVASVDISPFINQLPQNRSTIQFSTTNASGSTSQAANIMEALEVGARILLVDEDTAATNFMIRDCRMQQLIAKAKEPITPFIDKVRQLYNDYGVSTILVMGGSGDYFEVADRVIAMENFQPQDVTKKAKAIAQANIIERTPEGGENFGKITPRVPKSDSIEPNIRLKVRDVDQISFGNEAIDLSAVEQIVETGQLKAIAKALVYSKRYMDNSTTLSEILDRLIVDINTQGLDILTTFPQGDLVMFRRFELVAALNRLRTLLLL